MATIRERIDSTGKKTYHVQIRLRGFPPQTQSFNSKTIAKQWAAQVETELREGRYSHFNKAHIAEVLTRMTTSRVQTSQSKKKPEVDKGEKTQG